MTHSDYDHYGGLLDVLSGRLFDGRTFELEVENFYHSGLGRFKASPKLGETAQGEADPFPNGFHGVRRQGTFITELLDGKIPSRTRRGRSRTPSRSMRHW